MGLQQTFKDNKKNFKKIFFGKWINDLIKKQKKKHIFESCRLDRFLSTGMQKLKLIEHTELI